MKVLRHNMPFGNASGGDAGTYFIGYARSLHPLEKMLEAMVIGRPPGNYDRLLDSTSAIIIMRRVAESGGELEPGFEGVGQAPVA